MINPIREIIADYLSKGGTVENLRTWLLRIERDIESKRIGEFVQKLSHDIERLPGNLSGPQER